MRDSTPPSPNPSHASEGNGRSDAVGSKWNIKKFVKQAERSHRRLPGLKKVPLPAIAIILFIAFINVVVWIAAAIVLVCMTLLMIISTVYLHL